VAPKFEGAVALILRLDVFFDFVLLKSSMASSVSGSDGERSEVFVMVGKDAVVVIVEVVLWRHGRRTE